MTNYVGIDLGTTFSATAALDETGRPIIIHNQDGNNITPSVVSFTGPNRVEVGEGARRVYGLDPDTLGRFKRDMGTSITHRVQGGTQTPTSLSALVLKKLKEDVESALGSIREAVVTIPANFSNEAREATIEAAKTAGLNPKYIVNEPTAAALFYAFKSDHDLAGNYAVYDLGGGTFDISIVRISGHDVEVLATEGIAKLGGDDFDEVLRKIVTEKFEAVTGEVLSPEDFTKNDAEEEKKTLSRRDKCLVRVASDTGRANIEITRSEFEAAISSKVSQAEMVSESVLDDAGLTPDDINEVLLVGGSTRVPCVRDSVARVFGQEPTVAANVDEVVALGACLYAAYKGDRDHLTAIQKQSVDKIKVQEITSKSFGTFAVDHDENRNNLEKYNAILIKKNEQIPCSVTESFYTVYEDQEAVECSVTESSTSERDPKFVKVIWEGKLTLPAGRPKNQEIEVTFSYDSNQTMQCSFLDVETDKETTVDLQMGAKDDADLSKIEKFTVE